MLSLLSLAITRLGGELGRNSLKQSQSAIHHHRPRRKRNPRPVIFEIILYLTYVFNEFNSFIVSSSFLAPSVLINMCESVKACTAKTGVTSVRLQLFKRWITRSTGQPIGFANIYPLDSDFSAVYRFPTTQKTTGY